MIGKINRNFEQEAKQIVISEGFRDEEKSRHFVL